MVKKEIHVLTLLPVHRNFLIVNQLIISTLFNFFLNAGIVRLFYTGTDPVPLWGSLSIGFDTLATSFVLPWLTCYWTVVSIGFSIKMKWIPAITGYPVTGMIASFTRLQVIVQGVLHGLAGLLLFGVPATLWFMATGRETLSYSSFFVFKALFAALLSLAVSPLIGLFALFGDGPRTKSGDGGKIVK